MDDNLFGSSSESEGDAADIREKDIFSDDFKDERLENGSLKGNISTFSVESRTFTEAIDEQEEDIENRDELPSAYSSNTGIPSVNQFEEGFEFSGRNLAGTRPISASESSCFSSKIPFKTRPNPFSRRILTLRLPSTVTVSTEVYDGQKAHQNATDSKESSYLSSIRWWTKRDEHGQSVTDETGNPECESNTNLIEWNDGTYSLVVGDNLFDCELREEMAFIFEDSQETIKPLHCVAKERMQVRLSNIKEKRLAHYRKAATFQQRTKLTTLEEIESRQLLTQKNVEARRDIERMHRIQANAVKTSGLTGAFLEEDSDES